MLADAQKLIDEFVTDARNLLGLNADRSSIANDTWAAPHQTKDLPSGCGAVYGRVLKVGKVGPNSNPRFRYQHYAAGSAMSTLAGAIANIPLLWGYIGYPGRDTDVGKWIKENTDRYNFYFKDEKLIPLFEVYAKARLGPAFEGSLSSKA
ncbi:MAG: hypothetical protein HYX46_13755 [Betaproteobacteria bacterium]|nr:hypothetical protein [Betaproteobacteria bacterium]